MSDASSRVVDYLGEGGAVQTILSVEYYYFKVRTRLILRAVLRYSTAFSRTKLKGHSMAAYSELMAQAQALMAQAELARKSELAEAISDIKSKMKLFGITVADLGGAGAKKPAKLKSVTPPKFRGPNGELWAGGPGRKPEWVRKAVEMGKSIEEFRI